MSYKKIFFFFLSFLLITQVNAWVSQNIYTQGENWYCDEITFTNESNTKIQTWKLELTIAWSSEITSNWNSEYIKEGEKYTFTPVSYNHTIAVWESRTIGFCTTNTLSRPTNVTFKDLTQTNTQENTNNAISIFYPKESWPSKKVSTKSWEKIMQINPWNIASSNGDAQLSYIPESDSFTYEQNLSSIILNDVQSWVSGYPEVMIGKSPYSNTQTTGNIFPKKVDEIEKLLLKTQFSVKNISNTPLNYASEGWLLQNPEQNGVWKNDIEFMIMWYRSDLGPAGSKIGSVDIPLKVDGVQKQETFEIYYSNNSWNFFTFLPKSNYNNSDIEIDLAKFFPSMNEKLWNALKNYTFMTYEIGSEFGAPSINYGHFSWNLGNFELQLTPKNPQTSSNESSSNSNDSTQNNDAESENDFDIDEIYDLINTENNEQKFSFQAFYFTSKSFTKFNTKLDNYLTKKMKNYTTQKYNLWVENRNEILSILKKFEEKKVSQKETLQNLKKSILTFQKLHKK